MKLPDSDETAAVRLVPWPEDLCRRPRLGTGRRTEGEIKTRRLEEIVEWLRDEPSLDEICQTFPDEWARVQRDLGELATCGEVTKIEAYLERAARPLVAAGGRRRPQRELVSLAVQRHMAAALLSRAYTAAAARRTRSRRTRFGLVNGYIAQKLLFEHDLVRKPVPLPLFRMIWPFLWQRKLLMPLVMPQGIYCFYSRPLITELARLIGDRSCVEIAAGDGTLSRFLADSGVNITATDDHSWQRSISYPDTVKRIDARRALRRFGPQVVICSWPPAGNDFEDDVFAAASVELYIVISSRNEISAGNWSAYRAQSGFEQVLDERLTALVVPPELDSAVYLFHRRPAM